MVEQYRWEPLPDGDYPSYEMPASIFRVDGNQLKIMTRDTRRWGFLPDDLRLCRRVPVSAPDASDLLAACEAALHEMRHTVAPRDSFTDTVDMLDAAISKAKGNRPGGIPEDAGWP